MKNIFVIAKNTFRETIRDRILYGIVGFSFLYVAFSILLAKVSLGEIVILKSFGLAGIYAFGIIITIFLGASIIYKELERRTLYFVFSKPVSRLQLILGKFFGLYAAIVLVTALMTAVYLAVIGWNGGGFDALGLLSVFFELLEMAVFTALLVFFSTIATPLTSTIAAVMLLFGGHSMSSVLRTASQIGGPFYRFIQAVYYIFPNLEKFDIRSLAVHHIAVSASVVALAALYAILYTAILLWLANFFLKRKEL
ncbi:MAG TPA: ABC transporter permease subunit [Candidatus Paceibacterota bacterium]|nr:ABC transporter permease subunit [Candidatus Paceibacterota bacterium]